MKNDSNYFHFLDAIRGIAALIVLCRHTDYFFGWKLPESYLAVDLFFILSGVVVANAYELRLRDGMSVGSFMLIRLIRLYPLYLLGSVLGLSIMLAAHYGLPAEGLHGNIAWMLLSAALMLPMLSGEALYPLDTPAWSLFFELAANLFYAAIVRFLTESILLAIITMFAVGIAVSLYFSPIAGLHGGFSPQTILTGAIRVGFSFFAGVWLYRRFGAKTEVRTRALGGIPASVLLVVLLACLLARPASGAAHLYYDFFVVVVAFPVLIRLGMACRLAGKVAQICVLLGTLSYPVYVLHLPVARLVNGAMAKVLHLPLEGWVPYYGLAFLCFFLPACWWTDRLYDAPVRAWLTGRIRAAWPSGKAASAVRKT